MSSRKICRYRLTNTTAVEYAVTGTRINSQERTMNAGNIISIVKQTVVVILAAGKGARMGREDIAKVCFEIDGTAAINRIIETFRKRSSKSFSSLSASEPSRFYKPLPAPIPEQCSSINPNSWEPDTPGKQPQTLLKNSTIRALCC